MPYRSLLLSLLLFFSGCTAMTPTSLMTWNLRFNTPNDGDNWWEHRKEAVASLILKYEPGIFGTQEGLYGQLEYLDSALEAYQYVGVGRDDGQTKGEYAAIFYNTNTYKLIDTYTYWLSETPEKPSVGWDAAMERITTYAIFVDRQAGDTLHVFNCHYDHIGEVARENSSRLLLELIAKHNLPEKKLVVMGDFNAAAEAPPIKVLTTQLNDAYESTAVKPAGPFGTFNAFNIEKAPERRIDYIFTRNLEVKAYQVIDDRRENGLYPSDHLPVLVVVNP